MRAPKRRLHARGALGLGACKGQRSTRHCHDQRGPLGGAEGAGCMGQSCRHPATAPPGRSHADADLVGGRAGPTSAPAPRRARIPDAAHSHCEHAWRPNPPTSVLRGQGQRPACWRERGGCCGRSWWRPRPCRWQVSDQMPQAQRGRPRPAPRVGSLEHRRCGRGRVELAAPHQAAPCKQGAAPGGPAVLPGGYPLRAAAPTRADRRPSSFSLCPAAANRHPEIRCYSEPIPCKYRIGSKEWLGKVRGAAGRAAGMPAPPHGRLRALRGCTPARLACWRGID